MCWYISNGFSISDVDKCIYNRFENNTCGIICLYFNDMLIFGTSLKVVSETKKFLRSKFEMKYLGEIEVFLEPR